MNSIDFYCKDKKHCFRVNHLSKININIIMHRGKQQKGSVELSKSPATVQPLESLICSFLLILRNINCCNYGILAEILVAMENVCKAWLYSGTNLSKVIPEHDLCVSPLPQHYTNTHFKTHSNFKKHLGCWYLNIWSTNRCIPSRIAL